MCNDVIFLIRENKIVDDYGDTIVERVKTPIFAEVRSIGMRETYEAMALGLKPELTFVLADYYDYNEEEFIEYAETVYRVIRTYRKSHKLEIVVTKNAITE